MIYKSECKLSSQAPNNMSNYFFFKYGSSFNQFPYTRFTDSSIDHKSSTLMFPLGHLQVNKFLILLKNYFILNYIIDCSIYCKKNSYFRCSWLCGQFGSRIPHIWRE